MQDQEPSKKIFFERIVETLLFSQYAYQKFKTIHLIFILEVGWAQIYHYAQV